MQQLLLFAADGLCGYCLQAFAYLLAIWAMNQRALDWKPLLAGTALFSVITFGIRNIPGISFGFHTILTLIAFIGLAHWLFKTPLYPTVLAVLLTTIATILCEAVNVGALSAIIGAQQFTEAMKDTVTLEGRLGRALLGIPGNLLLCLLICLLYRFRKKFLLKVTRRGKTDTQTR